ncbi:MAG: hypothetical protein HC850_05560 [Rhodomicrobium sp.]|nr:hypothetical protein [Rhodomicrobium sp.]
MRVLIAAALAAFIATPLLAETSRVDKGAAILAAIQQDETKRKAYCELQELLTKTEQAIEKRNETEAKALSSKAEEKSQALGKDFVTLMALQIEADPATEDGKKYFAAWESLEKSCSKT